MGIWSRRRGAVSVSVSVDVIVLAPHGHRKSLPVKDEGRLSWCHLASRPAHRSCRISASRRGSCVLFRGGRLNCAVTRASPAALPRSPAVLPPPLLSPSPPPP